MRHESSGSLLCAFTPVLQLKATEIPSLLPPTAMKQPEILLPSAEVERRGEFRQIAVALGAVGYCNRH